MYISMENEKLWKEKYSYDVLFLFIYFRKHWEWGGSLHYFLCTIHYPRSDRIGSNALSWLVLTLTHYQQQVREKVQVVFFHHLDMR